jgi:hypothetical protein
MSMLDRLSDAEEWEAFWRYKTSLVCPKRFAEELRGFIDSRGYLPVCERISRGERFPLPEKSVISKLSTSKKRTVYTYPRAENMVMKLLTYLLIREYDGMMSSGLYSFRPGRSAKDAVRALTSVRGIGKMYSYKADISNYFNSVPVDKLLPMIEEITRGDERLYIFLRGLLTEPEVICGGKIITEDKGIMAGTPLSAFFANLYLRDMDRYFEERRVIYARYSDDVILFAETADEVRAHAEKIREILAERGLSLNPDKELFGEPDGGWTFLGFSCRSGIIDIAPVTVMKLKHKMRRKANALRRWRIRSGLSGEKAASAFIRIFNRKLLESAGDNELTWSFWFFSVINTTESLHAIDLYAQDCVRYLISDTRTKARFNVRYEDMKRLGLRSLVHEYYAFEKQE